MRIVVKVGTSTLAHPGGLLNIRHTEDLVKVWSDIQNAGHQLIVVSSAATGLLLDIYKEYGADSTLGKMASVMMSSTETIFYTMSVYFMSVKVKKTRYTLAGAFLATVAGTIASVVIVSCM